MFLQFFVFQDIYLTYGLIPIALLMILFSLETPDYRKLINTMDELENAKQEAWRANQVKTEFLANMSHEIRTPINAVLGFDEMILRESKEEDTITYATNIKNSGQSLLSLVNDILDLSKIEAGKMEIVPQEYDVVEMVSSLVKMITPRAEDKGLDVTLDIDRKIPRKLMGDDVRISQVLTNLLTNAVKYTQKGGITLQIKAEKLNKKNDKEVKLLFSVSDTGIGIKEENTEMLFSEFSRVEDENNRKIEGTGLGLPISMKCLNLMGSKLEVKSVYGQGSVFFFFIMQQIVDAEPVGDFEKARAKLRDEVNVFEEDFIAPDARILVVDDVELNLKVFTGLLKKSKMNIDTALSGAEAIELIKKNSYDCIFMDHQMPEMDGIETLKKLREDPEADIDKVPVIALTANAISGAKEMYMENGFSDYITKPVNGWDLSDLLHKWLPTEKIDTPEIEEKQEDKKQEEPLDEFTASAWQDVNKEDKKDIQAILSGLKAIGISTEDGLSFTMEDQDFYLELINDFVNDSEDRKKTIQNFFINKDWKNYEIYVHALKSSTKTLGINDLSEEAKHLEMAAKDKNVDEIEAKHGIMIEHFEKVIDDIRKII